RPVPGSGDSGEAPVGARDGATERGRPPARPQGDDEAAAKALGQLRHALLPGLRRHRAVAGAEDVGVVLDGFVGHQRAEPADGILRVPGAQKAHVRPSRGGVRLCQSPGQAEIGRPVLGIDANHPKSSPPCTGSISSGSSWAAELTRGLTSYASISPAGYGRKSGRTPSPGTSGSSHMSMASPVKITGMRS